MKMLNLDKLSHNATRQITLGGNVYSIFPISVNAFIETTRAAEQYMKEGEANELKEVEMVLDLLSMCIPDAPREALMSLGVSQLQILAEYVRGDDVDGAEVLDNQGN